MRVRCVSNKPEDAQSSHEYVGSGTGNNSPFYLLTPGKEYTVYAETRVDNVKLYLLLDDAQPSEDELLDSLGEPDPTWYASSLFVVVDKNIDSTWRKIEGTMWTQSGETISFPEFVKNGRNFYSKLLDGDKGTIDVFLTYVKKYKKAV